MKLSYVYEARPNAWSAISVFVRQGFLLAGWWRKNIVPESELEERPWIPPLSSSGEQRASTYIYLCQCFSDCAFGDN